jgi:hypothetical protein
VDAAIALMGADAGSFQMLEGDGTLREATDDLAANVIE